jgi:hypothetical protein
MAQFVVGAGFFAVLGANAKSKVAAYCFLSMLELSP